MGSAVGETHDEPTAAIDFTPLEQILSDFKGKPGAVIPILQRAQDAYGYLPRSVLAEISRRARIPLHQLYGVATFYAQFHLHRRGRHLVRICDGTACHVSGAGKAIDKAQEVMGIGAGATSPDYRYTLEIVYCLGSCGLSPVAVVDDKVCGRLTPEVLVRRLEELQ